MISSTWNTRTTAPATVGPQMSESRLAGVSSSLVK